MDKAVIFSVYDFVSFHVCKELLNKGLEVNGLLIEDEADFPFLDEKRLEVGRNANFIELSHQEWGNMFVQDTSKTALIFSIYDLYMLRKDLIFQKEEIVNPIIRFIERHNNELTLIFFLPIQAIQSNEEKEIIGLLSQAKRLAESMQIFYLPSLYGPWQPSAFLFHQALVSSICGTEIKRDDREWTEDTLFIDDVVESITDIMMTGESGSYLLESGKKNYWELCAGFLKLDKWFGRSDKQKPLNIDRQIVRIPVKKVTSITDSITRQMEILQRMYGNQS